MPCPADRSGEDVVVQRFQLVDKFDNNDSNHVNCASTTTNNRNFLTASKLTPHHLPIQSLDINAAANPLTSNGAFWSPLKAIPLASYYKLHRVPSLSTMTEPDLDEMDAVQLPQSESTAEPTEQMAENGVQNAVKLPRRESTAEPTEQMAENGVQNAVKLPRRESTAEPSERLQQNGVHNKILEQVVRTPGRQPSPQPTHLSVPGSSQHKVLHEEGSGYVAPKFEGKELQMDQGMPFLSKNPEG